MIELIIGLIVGLIVGLNIRSKERVKNNLPEIIIAFISIFIFLFIMWNNRKGYNNNSLEDYEILLSFFSSFIFSWILTKYTSSLELKERERDLAIQSFRHSRNLISKMEYSILIASLLKEDSTFCKQSESECELSYSLNRVKDLLITFKRDANEIKNDWSDVIANDIALYKKIELNQNKIMSLSEQIQDEETDEDEVKELEWKVEKLQNEKDKLEEELDVRVKLALNEQFEIDNEMNSHVNNERKEQQVKRENIKPRQDVSMPKKKSVAKK